MKEITCYNESIENTYSKLNNGLIIHMTVLQTNPMMRTICKYFVKPLSASYAPIKTIASFKKIAS